MSYDTTVVNGTDYGMSPSIPDNSAAFQLAINSVPAGGTIRIPGCSFAAGVTITKSMTILGSGVSYNTGTVLFRTGDFTLITVTGTTGAYIGVNFVDIILNSTGGPYTVNPMCSMSYIQGAKCDNFNIRGAGTDTTMGLALNAVEDSTFSNCTFLGIGSATNGSLHFLTANGNYSCNDLKFTNCHFEFGGNVNSTFIIMEAGTGGGFNNSIEWDNCKFETTATTTSSTIWIKYGQRLTFSEGCRLTNHGPNAPAILVNSGTYLIFKFLCLSSSTTSIFGSFTGVNGLRLATMGSNIGTYTIDPTTTRLDDSTEYDSTQVVFARLPLDGNQNYGLNYLRNQANTNGGLTLVSEPAEYLTYAIQSLSTDATNILKVYTSSHSRHRDGATLWFRAICNQGTGGTNLAVQVRIRNTAGGNVVVATPTIVNSGYAIYSAPFTPDQLNAIGAYVNINTNTGFTSSGGYVRISEFYWEDNWTGTSAPGSGTWEVGAKVRNLTPTSSGTAMWFCTTAPSTFTALALP